MTTATAACPSPDIERFAEIVAQLTPEQQNVLMLLTENTDTPDQELCDGLKAYGYKLRNRLGQQGEDMADIVCERVDLFDRLTAGIPQSEAMHWIALLVGCIERRDRDMWSDAVRLIELRKAA